jgi:hypothetical protein
MSDKLGNYLSNYIQGRAGVFKKYLLATLNSRDQCIWYLESSEGTLVPSADLKNCELLRDAQIFHEDVRISRSGRNTYKVFCLTDFGRQLADDIKKESVIGAETGKSDSQQKT